MKIHDTNGAFTMWHVEFMLSPEGGGWQWGYNFQPVQRCKVVAEASANIIWVEGDSENQQVGIANFGAGSPSSISSGRCTLYPSMTSLVYTDIDTEVITFAVSFSSNLTGQLQDHMYIADNLGLDHWDSQSDGTWNWTVGSGIPPSGMSAFTRMTAKSGAAVSPGCSGSPGSGLNLSDDGIPVPITWTSCDGRGDARYFTSCSVSGSGVTVSLGNLQQLSFSTTLTAAVDASPGPRTLTCLWYYGYAIFQAPITVINTFYKPNGYYSEDDLNNAASGLLGYDAIDSSGNVLNPQLSPDAFNYLQANGFISAQDAVNWTPVLITIPGLGEVAVAVIGVSVGVYISYQATRALITWVEARGNHDPALIQSLGASRPGDLDSNGNCGSIPPTPFWKWQAIDKGGQWAGQVHWHWIQWYLNASTCTWFLSSRMEGLTDPGPGYIQIPGVYQAP